MKGVDQLASKEKMHAQQIKPGEPYGAVHQSYIPQKRGRGKKKLSKITSAAQLDPRDNIDTSNVHIDGDEDDVVNHADVHPQSEKAGRDEADEEAAPEPAPEAEPQPEPQPVAVVKQDSVHGSTHSKVKSISSKKSCSPMSHKKSNSPSAKSQSSKRSRSPSVAQEEAEPAKLELENDMPASKSASPQKSPAQA